MSCNDIEEIVTTSHIQPSQTQDIDAKLTIWKLKVLPALTCKTYLNPLHEHLATKAESLTSLNSLYGDHPSHEIDFEIKETMAITISSWYTKYRLSNPLENHRAKIKDLDYPIVVLLPVLIELIFPPQEIDAIIEIPYPLNKIHHNLFHFLLGEENITTFCKLTPVLLTIYLQSLVQFKQPSLIR